MEQLNTLCMDDSTKTVCVTSYNSGGMGLDKQNYIKSLTLFSDILCIQEHFLLDSGNRKYSNTQKLKKLFGHTHDMIIKPAYKCETVLSQGRGMGGLVTLWRKSYTKYVTSIKSDNFRVQAFKIRFPEAELLLFNLYFMVDPQNNNFNDNQLLQLLAEIDRIISLSDCRNILMAGDLNCDFSRNTHFVNHVRRFIEEKGLSVFWNNPDNDQAHSIANVPFTYSNTVNNITHSSIIDHFIGNRRLFNAVQEANVLNSVDNHSNHLPIYCKFIVNQLNLNTEERVFTAKPSWDKATPEQRELYRVSLDEKLGTIFPPVQCLLCENFKCDRHAADVDEYATSVCEAVDSASKKCLPVSGRAAPQGRRGIPGWSEYVKPFQEESKFWHGVWLAAGSPNQGELYNLYRSTKMQYKYAVRRLKRATYNIQQDKFVQGLLNGGVNIFSEIKKFRGQTSTLSSCIDGEVGSDNISNNFSQIYSELYSKHTHGVEFEEMVSEVNSKINNSLAPDIEKVNTNSVRLALEKLKSGKSDCQFDFKSDCLLNASNILIEHVTILFRWFLRSGTVPAFLLLCTLVPIVKDNLGDITASDNYRAIAIGSLLLKWFDWLLLIIEGDKLSNDELQFGFQPKSSTSMCSWAVSTVIDYYNQAGRNVFACAMDLSKAFDLVSWEKLFKDLIEREVSPLFLRCLLYIYSNQTCAVRWGNSVSPEFRVYNGVRQGAVSSPLLFSIYINKVIKLLRHSTLGCQIQGVYLGIWVYADDIVLLAPSRNALQEMINICEKFANCRLLKFSTNRDINKSKTKCLIFTKSVIDSNNFTPIFLGGVALPYVSEVKHLGNVLQTNNSMNKDCDIKRAKFISMIHSLNQEFHFVHPSQVVKLYKIYATSFYGSSIWNLYCDNVSRLYTSWNVAIRILFKLPRETHRYFIEPLSESIHVKTMLCSRFISFFDSLCSSSKLCIRVLANVAKNDQRTVLGKNLTNIANDCKVDKNDLSSLIVKNTMCYSNIQDDDKWKVDILKELIDCKYNNSFIPDFNSHDIDLMINYVCTS